MGLVSIWTFSRRKPPRRATFVGPSASTRRTPLPAPGRQRCIPAIGGAQALGRRPAMCRLLQLRHGGALLPLEQLQDGVCLGGFGSHVYASMIPRPLHAGAVTAQSPGGVAPSTGRAVLEVFRSLRAPYRAVTLPLSSQRKSNGETDRPAPKPARTRLPPASQSPPTTGTASPGASASTSPPRERQSDATPSSSGRGRSRSYGTGKVVLIVIRSAVLVVGSAPTIRL